MLQGDHGLEETVCQLRHEFGNDFIAVDEGMAVAMDMLKLTLELETQQSKMPKLKLKIMEIMVQHPQQEGMQILSQQTLPV
jgi:hypothetical protein